MSCSVLYIPAHNCAAAMAASSASSEQATLVGVFQLWCIEAVPEMMETDVLVLVSAGICNLVPSVALKFPAICLLSCERWRQWRSYRGAVPSSRRGSV